MSQAPKSPLAFAHIGDLYLTRAARQNFVGRQGATALRRERA
jgi:hypothetical protein